MSLSLILSNIEQILSRSMQINKFVSFVNYYNMVKDINIDLSGTVIPVVPILWYREEQTVLATNNINLILIEEVKNKYNYDSPLNLFYVEQTHWLKGSNVYICLHSLLYYELNKTNVPENKTFLIPDKYNVNKNFEVMIVPLNANIIEVPNGLKQNQYVSGPVYIHDKSFSPPGTLHFKLDETREMNEFICYVKNDELNVHIGCLYKVIN